MYGYVNIAYNCIGVECTEYRVYIRCMAMAVYIKIDWRKKDIVGIKVENHEVIYVYVCTVVSKGDEIRQVISLETGENAES